MNEQKFLEKVSKLLLYLPVEIQKEALRLYRSGAVDVEKYEDDYQLPKMVLHVAIKNLAEEFKPLFKDVRITKELKNLSRF